MYDGTCVSGDCKNGTGTMHYSNGNTYTGEWVDGMRHGEGTLHIYGGDKYVGEWNNNKMNGQGTLYYKDGKKYAGWFSNDVINGFGILYASDGSIIHDGKFSSGNPVYGKCTSGDCKNGKGVQ